MPLVGNVAHPWCLDFFSQVALFMENNAKESLKSQDQIGYFGVEVKGKNNLYRPRSVSDPPYQKVVIG